MSLSFSGVDLTPDWTDEFWSKLDKWWVREQPNLISYPGYTALGINQLPIPDRPKQQLPIPLNTLVWPSCASRWGEFITFVGGVQKNAIEAAIGVQPIAQPLVISDTTNGTAIPPVSMYMLALRPIYVQSAPNMQIWMLHLVDCRYYWWLQDFSFIGPNSGWFPGISWPVYLQNLINLTNFTNWPVPVTIPPVSINYTSPGIIGPSERWLQTTQPLPPMIDAAAKAVGFRFIRGLDGTLSFVTALGAIAADIAQYNTLQPQVAFGGRVSVTDISGTIPVNVNCDFFLNPLEGGSSSNALENLLSLPGSTISPLYGVPGSPVTYGNKIAEGYIAADYTGPVTTTYSNNYAIQACTDYYNWLLSLTDCTLRSIQPVVPTGMEDRIEWEYLPRLFTPITEMLMPDDVSQIRKPWQRIATRIVPRDRGDNNLYGTWSVMTTSGEALYLGVVNWTSIQGSGTFYSDPTAGGPAKIQLVGNYVITTTLVFQGAYPTDPVTGLPSAASGLYTVWLEIGSGSVWGIIGGTTQSVSAFDMWPGNYTSRTITFQVTPGLLLSGNMIRIALEIDSTKWSSANIQQGGAGNFNTIITRIGGNQQNVTFNPASS